MVERLVEAQKVPGSIPGGTTTSNLPKETSVSNTPEMWRDYPDFKRPIVPSDFLDVFEARIKEMGYDQLRIDGELDPFYAEFKCKVTVIQRMKYTNSDTMYDSHAASFKLEHMAGCGGILISHDSYVTFNERKKGLGALMQEMKLWIANKLQAGMLLATVIVGNEREESLLTKNGWQKVGPTFRNVHTENEVQMWQRILT